MPQAAAAANKGAATAAALEAADAAVEQGKPFLVLQLQVGGWVGGALNREHIGASFVGGVPTVTESIAAGRCTSRTAQGLLFASK